jgi:hypothetical protein
MPMGTRADFSALEWAGLKCETRVYLIEAARQQRTVYYKDVAQQFKDRRLHHKSEAMVDLLGEISAEEHAAGRPLLSAVWFATTRSCLFQAQASTGWRNNWVP